MDPNAQPAPAPTPVAPAPAAPAPAPEQPLFANNGTPAVGGAPAPKKSHTGLIVGLIIGIIAIAAVLIVVFAVVLPNANKSEEKKDDNTSKEETKKDPEPEPEPVKKTKTLTCTQVAEDDEDYKQTAVIKFIYVDDELDKVEMTEENWKSDGFSDAELEAAQKENNSHYDSDRYSKWVVKRKDKYTLVLEAELNLEKQDTSEFKTYEDAKTFGKEAGFNCQ